MVSRTIGDDVTTYGWSPFGNLEQVMLPDGTEIAYELDPTGRRVGRSVDGVRTHGWIGPARRPVRAAARPPSLHLGPYSPLAPRRAFGHACVAPGCVRPDLLRDGTARDALPARRAGFRDHLNPVAQLDADGRLEQVYLYGTQPHVPDAILEIGAGGTVVSTWRVVTDVRGSVRLVVNADTGAVAQELRYSPFGEVLHDSNPRFQPFGFAGGLWDTDTGLVRFGAREYDARLGRWLSRDPILFNGGDTNLFGYVLGDPVNWVDPEGLEVSEDEAAFWQAIRDGEAERICREVEVPDREDVCTDEYIHSREACGDMLEYACDRRPTNWETRYRRFCRCALSSECVRQQWIEELWRHPGTQRWYEWFARHLVAAYYCLDGECRVDF